MQRLIYLFALAAALCGCICDEEPECCPSTKVTVEMEVRPDPMTVVTRTTDETAISDVNLYLCDATGRLVVHAYATAPTLRFTCVPGTYRMYVAANLGRDAGEDMLPNDLRIEHADEYDVLPMTYEGEVTISASAKGPVTLPSVVVQRAVAKVSCNISVQPEDMELLSIQLVSMPRSVRLFDAEATPSNDADDYVDTEVLQLGGRTASAEYYLLPNPQGENPSITEQRQKNASNAPVHATFLRLRALRGDRVLTYTVYLGENNTSDFNVRANRHYRLNISVLGDKDIDIRMSAYTVRVWDDFDDYSYGGYCFLDGTRYLHVDMECYDDSAPVRGHLEVLAGDTRSFTFNSGNTGASHDFDICDRTGDNEYEMAYYVAGYSAANALLSYRVTLTDAYGFTQSYDFEHRMANAVYVIATAGGTLSALDARHVEPMPVPYGSKILVLFSAATVRLKAAAAAGMSFEGWYSDVRHEHLLSADPEYLYTARAPLRYLYAAFRYDAEPLDTHGTANCYIAPQLGAWYSFDAQVMGNGKATLNITPQPLSGTEARVIWETGSEKGAVIESVRYDDGRICFLTGKRYGNALIGLFDTAGRCVWSWHIWSTNYDPEIGAQTYYSGKIFMMRNLGALTSDFETPESRGLYYQWGRKDPFLGPASISDYSGTAPAVYHISDYEYSMVYPPEYEPEEIMTIAWATAHPTTFIDAAMYPDWDDHADILDWLYTRHPNLWGNRTTGTPINPNSSKSIYDPCPPGWRVPDLQDFKNIVFFTDNTPGYTCAQVSATTLARFPMGGSFNGIGFFSNGSIGRVYTCSPYDGSKGSSVMRYVEYDCASIYFSRSDIGCTSALRSSANPVRCVKE